MRRFQFRLERVLGYRRYLEEAAYDALQRAIRRRVELEQSLKEHKKRWRSAAQACQEPGEWNLREQYLTALQEQIEQWQALLPMLQAEEEQVRETYLKARRARESLDRLRQHAYERYRASLEAELQKNIDEWVRTHSGRGNS